MLVKMILSIIIIVTTTGIGYIISYGYTKRLKELKHLNVAFQLLETEIVYTSTSLPHAMKRVGYKSNEGVRNIFIDTYKILKQRLGGSMEDAWTKAIKNNLCQMALTQEDEEILLDFGKNLGVTDQEHQLKNFKFVYVQLKKQEDDAQQLKTKNGKMYKSLGILLGFAIVILFI